jgi:hypothetical protein
MHAIIDWESTDGDGTFIFGYTFQFGTTSRTHFPDFPAGLINPISLNNYARSFLRGLCALVPSLSFIPGSVQKYSFKYNVQTRNDGECQQALSHLYK